MKVYDSGSCCACHLLRESIQGEERLLDKLQLLKAKTYFNQKAHEPAAFGVMTVGARWG